MTNFNNTLDFLDWAFVALLKRTPSPQESQHLEAAIETQSMTQLQVLALIIDGQEYRNSNIDNEFVPSGHFYSAVPSLADRRRVLDSPTQSAPPPGIDLNHTTQVQLLKSFEQYYDDNLFAVEKCSERRYYSNNPAFSWHDAFVLHAMIKSFKPRSIIEIGCGFSSGVTLDCIEDIDNYTPEVVFIEPFPETLNSVLYPQDSILCGLIDTLTSCLRMSASCSDPDNPVPINSDSSPVSDRDDEIETSSLSSFCCVSARCNTALSF